uniref:Sugar phosphate transporter domain-containing protein n=1 Tax=Eutreptiella gymnastica TaxID=73025 RepID=A0A7S4CM97_9EUGL
MLGSPVLPLPPTKASASDTGDADDEVSDYEAQGENQEPKAVVYTRFQCLQAALLYSVTGIGITLVNKTTLSLYKFPSSPFLAFAQLIVTVLLVGTLKYLNVVQFEDVSMRACRMIWPLPVFFLGNAVTSLGGTKAVTIPTFSALRKFSILFTMFLELRVLGKTPSFGVQSSIAIMILGSFVAAVKDLNFDMLGYTFVMANNVFTAGNYVVAKQKADTASLGATGTLFYCALVSLPGSFLLACPDFKKVYEYPHWSDRGFWISFLISTAMGCMVTFSTIHCTKVNSGLTTSVIGCLRNVIPVYLGMLHIFEYTFNVINFAGHTISVAGAIAYSYFRLNEGKK